MHDPTPQPSRLAVTFESRGMSAGASGDRLSSAAKAVRVKSVCTRHQSASTGMRVHTWVSPQDHPPEVHAIIALTLQTENCSEVPEPAEGPIGQETAQGQERQTGLSDPKALFSPTAQAEGHAQRGTSVSATAFGAIFPRVLTARMRTLRSTRKRLGQERE